MEVIGILAILHTHLNFGEIGKERLSRDGRGLEKMLRLLQRKTNPQYVMCQYHSGQLCKIQIIT